MGPCTSGAQQGKKDTAPRFRTAVFLSPMMSCEVLRENLRGDVARDVGEAEISTCVAIG